MRGAQWPAAGSHTEAKDAATATAGALPEPYRARGQERRGWGAPEGEAEEVFMKTAAFLGAVAGGLVGAVLWAVIACTTGMEIGYVAWAVGGLVGFGAYALGGRGKAAGVTCAGIAAAAILVGKVFTIQQFVGGFSIEAIYEELLPKAEAFGQVGRRRTPAFMVAHEYTAAETPQK